jgi:hypothetical protein
MTRPLGPMSFFLLESKTLYSKCLLPERNMPKSIFWKVRRGQGLFLSFSVPYVKDWIDSHPMSNRQDAFLFPSLADSNFGEQLTENSLYKQYTRTYKKHYFPKLLKDPSIPDADKAYIKNLLTKPWNPYVQRHSALTAKSQILKESTLRDHAGWSMTSRNHRVVKQLRRQGYHAIDQISFNYPLADFTLA